MKKLLLILMALLLFAYPSFAETADDVEYRMSAIVTEADSESFTVEWADGKQYAFKIASDTNMEDLDGKLEAGKTVFISYTGEIDWEECDAGDVHVNYIANGDMDEIDYISGILTDGSMHDITIKWANNREYSFFIGDEVDKSGLGDEGMGLDMAIKIGYIGMIDWESGDDTYVHVVSVAKGEPETVSEVTGTVIDAAMHSVFIETPDGEQYGFSDNGDVDKSGLKDGVGIDNTVKISFVGSLELIDYAHMIAIADA